jgi:uncharacterized Zn-binding protein involved in type VI secretion
MPAVTRLGDVCTGHGCYPPRLSAEASPDTFANGFRIHRKGDLWAPHTCETTHNGVLVGGSSTVFINGKAAGRIGDRVSCGSVSAQGSPSVFIG